MNELTKEKTMTVKEISQVLGVTERLIQEKCKELFPEIVKNGVKTILNEGQITLIKMSLERNPHLERTFEVKTDLQMSLQLEESARYFRKKYEDAQKEIETLKPKALFFDTVADSKTAIEMSQVAKVIDMGYGNEKVLMSNNIPYQKYIDLEYFRVIEQKFNKPDGSICVNTKTLVYQKGIEFIIRKIRGI